MLTATSNTMTARRWDARASRGTNLGWIRVHESNRDHWWAYVERMLDGAFFATVYASRTGTHPVAGNRVTTMEAPTRFLLNVTRWDREGHGVETARALRIALGLPAMPRVDPLRPLSYLS